MIAFLSDVHSNLQAFEACMAHARQAGATDFVFLGDLVGYGANPTQVVERVMDLVDKGARAVQGNHDDLTPNSAAEMNPHASAAALWTAQNMSPTHLAFLKSLPLRIEEDDRLYVHADASAPAHWRYVDTASAAARSLAATDQRIVFCGHVHKPMIYAEAEKGHALPFAPIAGKPAPLIKSRRWHVVLGSVGQPRNRDPAASYCLYEPLGREIRFHRVAYDIDAAADAIRKAGLPLWLADRLYDGV